MIYNNNHRPCQDKHTNTLMVEDAPDENNYENQKKMELENGKSIKNNSPMYKHKMVQNRFAIDFSRFLFLQSSWFTIQIEQWSVGEQQRIAYRKLIHQFLICTFA